jgi:cell fate regulator YaaT (PSP1 superfamily)
VKVEGDRGYEIGVVCQRTVQSSASRPFFAQNGQPALRKILGRATENEKKYLLMKLRDESRALHICNELAARRKLPILMLDAEFQSDRNKLTFFYVSDV